MICRVAFLIPLVLASLAHASEPKDFVRLNKVDYSIKTQLNHGAPRECVLLKDVATALVRAQAAVKLTGLTLKVLECYRPFASSPKLPEAERQELARGNVVEVIVVDASGSPAMLPKPHDQAIILSAKPYSRKEAKKNQKKLTDWLRAEGFEPTAARWWRFTYVKPLEPAVELTINDFPATEVPRIH